MKTNIPRLRFIEFKDAPAWEEKKLCEEAQITMGQSPSSKFYSIDSNSTILIQGNADLKKGSIVPRIYTDSVTKCCQKNDIIMTVRAPVGDLAISEYDACIGRGVCAIKGNKYIYYVLEKLKETSYWDKLSTGTTISAVTSNDIKELKLKKPNLLEQEKIGKFLSTLDKRIELQEKLIEKLEEEKKGYLQKLFPKKGKNIPELRFEEFKDDGEWDKRNLGEISDVRDGTHDSPKYLENGIKLITSKNLCSNGKIDLENISYVSTADALKINERSKVSVGDILFGMIGTIGNPVIVENNDFVIKNIALIKEKSELLNTFCLQYLKSESLFRQFYEKQTGGTQKFISLTEIRSLKIQVPVVHEQKKIGETIHLYDVLISKERLILTKFQLQKLFYLNNIMI